MAGRGPQTFKKRQKEQQRKDKQLEKRAKRLERKANGPETESESGLESEQESGDLSVVEGEGEVVWQTTELHRAGPESN